MAGKHPKKAPRPGVDGLGRTPLHYAANDGAADIVLRLLQEGADPALADDNGWTALHFAAQSNAVEAARALLDGGAPVDPIDVYGNTPLFKAVFNSQGAGELIKLLRSQGADPRRANFNGVSPVCLARRIANFDVKQFFVDVEE